MLARILLTGSRLWLGVQPLKGGTGFTLVELMIAIGIIGIMTTALLATLDPLAQLQKGNDARRKSDLALIQRSLEEYYNDIGLYPGNDAAYHIITIPWGDPWLGYMSILPKDPSPNRTYVYKQLNPPVVSGSGQGYVIYASLERNSDPQSCTGSGGPCSTLSTHTPVIADDACGDTCNYAVSSPNYNPN